MKKQQFPILEFDANSPPVVQAKHYLPEYLNQKCTRAVLTYFSDVVERYERIFKVNQAFKMRTEGVRPRACYMKAGPKKELIYVVPMPVGAPQAARVMEILAAIGVKKFMICGGAGTLDDCLTKDNVLIPIAAVRDEGTSYHYLPPAREVHLDPKVIESIENTLTSIKQPFVRVKTWTTDAIFRETADKVELRKSEGCSVVEMECAAFYSVAQHKGLTVGQILYAGDSVKPDEWDYRDWHDAYDQREKLFEIAVKCLLEL